MYKYSILIFLTNLFTLKYERISEYRIPIGGGYEFELSWNDYPAEGYFASPSGKHTNAYSIGIKGQREISQGFLKRKKISEFPSLDTSRIDVDVDDDRNLVEGYQHSLSRFLDKETLEKIKDKLIEIEEKLRKELKE